MRIMPNRAMALALVFVLISFSIAAETPPVGPGETAMPHNERQGDPYLPPEISPGSPRATEPRGPANSVQVNTNAMGMNIPNDAANEPSLAIDPTDPNRIVIGWRQFDNIASNFRQAGWAYSSDGGQTWTFPGVLEPGVFRSDPVLAADGFGRFFYNSLRQNFCVDVWRSLDGGVTWPVHPDAFGGDKQWMDADQRTYGFGAGHLYQAWSTGASCGPGQFTRSTDGGQTWDIPMSTPQPSVFGTVAVGPDGELYVGGVDGPFFFNPDFVVLRSTNAKYPNQTPIFDVAVTGNFLGGAQIGGGGPNPDGLLGQTWIAVNHTAGTNRGHVYMLASVQPPGGDPLDVRFTRSTDGGQTWSPSIRVNDDPTNNGAWQWFGTMSVAPNGRIDAIWNDTRDDPGNQLSRVYYSYSTDEGVTWTPNVPLTPAFNSLVGFPNQNKIGDYYDMESDLTGANLAYSATFNGEQDVYFMRITVDDCNTNGITDADDIANMTSTDCNSNGVPDECENDCNTNGIADACDIADMTSEDCNLNGHPDECEVGGLLDCNTNGVSDLCDIFTQTSQDCNGNLIPDECDIASSFSDDCNTNGVPDECEPDEDCNTNGVADICDIAQGTSFDCDNDNVPNECQLDGTHVLFEEGFASGLPIGWTATGLWHTTAACPRPEPCEAAPWAYYGLDASCNFNTGATNSGVLTAPAINIPANALQATLYYCSAYAGQGGNSNTSGQDWAWVAANGVEVDDVSLDQSQLEWEVRSIDLTAFAGQSVTLSFRFDSRGTFLNTFLGWEIDGLRLEAVLEGSLDCDDNVVPDACEIANDPTLDCNENGVLDVCEAPVVCTCQGLLGDVNGDSLRDGLDIGPFTACYLAGVPTTASCGCADMDASGVVDDLDADLFIDCLLDAGCP